MKTSKTLLVSFTFAILMILSLVLDNNIYARYSIDYKNNVVIFNGHIFHHFYCPSWISLTTCNYNDNLNLQDPCPYMVDVIHCDDFYSNNDNGEGLNTYTPVYVAPLIPPVFREDNNATMYSTSNDYNQAYPLNGNNPIITDKQPNTMTSVNYNKHVIYYMVFLFITKQEHLYV